MVTVVNKSDRFASFQVSVEAAGAAPGTERNWYELKPDVSSKTPPGGVAQFPVTISRNPLPGFVGEMDISVRLFSVELPDSETRQLIHLTVEEGTEAIPLNLKLPVQSFSASPGKKITIPVQLEQLGHRPVLVEVKISGLEESWLREGAIERLSLPPNKLIDLEFICQLPATEMALAQEYPFTIQANFLEGEAAQVQGVKIEKLSPTAKLQGKLEILPQGKIIVDCEPHTCQIPARHPWLPNLQSKPVIYNLKFDNQSNLEPYIGASLYQSEFFPSYWQIIPQDGPELSVLSIKIFLFLSKQDYRLGLLFLREYPRIKVNLGQRGELGLKVNTKRHWFGEVKTLDFLVTIGLQKSALEVDNERKPVLEVENERQFLSLRVYPKIPLWLTVIAGLFLLGLCWNFSCLNPSSRFCGHQQAVKSIQFNGRGLNAVSGGDDRTIIEWNVEGFGWQNLLVPPTIGRYIRIGNNQSPQLKPKAVRVVRYKPVDNKAIAAGLENGEIQIWNLLGSRKCPQAVLPDENLGNRVLDLAFPSDAKFLYSSYGNGKILQWQVPSVSETNNNCTPIMIKPTKGQAFNFAIYSLTLVGENEKYLALAGQYNTLCLAERNLSEGKKCELVGNRDGNAQDYIQSVDKAEGKPYLLASADNQGRITIWNLKDCLKDAKKCNQHEPADRWPENQEKKYPLYSVALSDNGCYLVSGGQSGEVRLWSLKNNGQRASPDSIILKRDRQAINTVDIKIIDETIYVFSGGDKTQVNLNTYQTKKLPQARCD
jgi:WD40 repeat protein